MHSVALLKHVLILRKNKERLPLKKNTKKQHKK